MSEAQNGSMPPLRDDAVRLSDGRRLAYAEWGDPGGTPVFFFHGTPLSRLYCPGESITASSRVRLVTVDRPGIGGSDVLPRRTFADWPEDVVELADALDVDVFSVVGWSAGGPYAAACAARIPSRLTGVGIGACRHLSQYNVAENPSAYEQLRTDERLLYQLAHRDPDAAARASADADEEMVRTLWEDPEAWLKRVELPKADLWYLEDPERGRTFVEAVRESVRQGPEAFAWEEIDCYLPWGFHLKDISVEVHVFHGEQDTWVDRRHADFIAETLPNARLTVWADSGHGPARHWGEVLEAVTAG
jgi:pimeloyl-ACP methyl ester carboxylesterase